MHQPCRAQPSAARPSGRPPAHPSSPVLPRRRRRLGLAPLSQHPLRLRQPFSTWRGAGSVVCGGKGWKGRWPEDSGATDSVIILIRSAVSTWVQACTDSPSRPVSHRGIHCSPQIRFLTPFPSLASLSVPHTLLRPQKQIRDCSMYF